MRGINLIDLKTTFEVIGEDFTEFDWNDFLDERNKIILQTEDFPRRGIRPYRSSVFVSALEANNHQWASWATVSAKMDAFRQHLNSFHTITDDDSYLQDDSKIANLISDVGALNSYLGAEKIFELKPMLVVIFGHESKGKTSLLDEYLGQPGMSFTAADQGTICPVAYHVKKARPSIALPDRFNGTVYYWNTDIESSDPNLALTASDFKDKMRAHMTALKARAGGQNTATEEVLNCAIYSQNARFEGIILDLPGWRDSITPTEPDAENKLKVRQISFDTLVRAVSKSHEASIFLCVESVSDDASRKSLSFKDVTDYFSANYKDLLNPLLKRTIIVLNQFNRCFDYNSTSDTLEWRRSTNIEALENNLKEILSQTEKFPTFYPPTLVGFDYNQQQLPYSRNKDVYDIALDTGARINLNKIYPKISVGLKTIHSIILNSRRQSIGEMVEKTKESIWRHQNVLSRSAGASPAVYEEDVFEAVKEGFDRFITFVGAYSNGKNKKTGKTIENVRFPFSSNNASEDIARNFAYALYNEDQGISVVKKLKQSKFSVGGKVVTVDNEEEITNHLVEFLKQTESFLHSGCNTKDGKRVAKDMLALIAALLQSIQLEAFDSEIANRVQCDDDIVEKSNFLKGIQTVVINDFRSLSEFIVGFLEDTLKWFFDSLVDVVLLLERVEDDEDQGDSALTVLDRDYSALVLRSRLKLAYQAWVGDFMRDMKTDIRHSRTHDPLQQFVMFKSQLESVSEFSFIDPDVLQLPLEADSNEDKAKCFQTILSNANDLNTKLKSSTPPANGNQLMAVLFGEMIDYSGMFSAANKELYRMPNHNGQYSRLFFNSLKSKSWGHIIMELKRIIPFFDPTINTSDHYIKSLEKKLNAFVFNRVAYPMLLDINDSGVRIRSKKTTMAHWSNNQVVLEAADGKEQDIVLVQMYNWTESQRQAVVPRPERIILEELEKFFPQGKDPLSFNRKNAGVRFGRRQPVVEE